MNFCFLNILQKKWSPPQRHSEFESIYYEFNVNSTLMLLICTNEAKLISGQ